MKSIKVLFLSIPIFLIVEIFWGILAGMGLEFNGKYLLHFEVGIAMILSWVFLTLRENKKEGVEK